MRCAFRSEFPRNDELEGVGGRFVNLVMCPLTFKTFFPRSLEIRQHEVSPGCGRGLLVEEGSLVLECFTTKLTTTIIAEFLGNKIWVDPAIVVEANHLCWYCEAEYTLVQVLWSTG